MFKRIIFVLILSINSFVNADVLDKYFDSEHFLWFISNKFPEGIYSNSGDDGFQYVMSENSGKDFCWIKDIKDSKIEKFKFYIDYTNKRYVPETYGWMWNEMCKTSKKKRNNIKQIISDEYWKIRMFVGYYDNEELNEIDNPPEFKNQHEFQYLFYNEETIIVVYYYMIVKINMFSEEYSIIYKYAPKRNITRKSFNLSDIRKCDECTNNNLYAIDPNTVSEFNCIISNHSVPYGIINLVFPDKIESITSKEKDSVYNNCAYKYYN